MKALLLDISVKGCLLLLLTGVLSLALRRASASLRHYLWALALIGLLILPALAVALPGWRIPVLPGEAAVPAAVVDPTPPPMVPIEAPVGRMTAGGADSRGAAVPIDAEATSGPGSPPAATSVIEPPAGREEDHASPSQAAWLGALWLLGLVLCVLPLPAGLLAVRRLARASRPLDHPPTLHLFDELVGMLCPHRRVQVRLIGETRTPMAFGFLRPVILLPADAVKWTRSRLRAVLTHELAHVRRRDCAIEAIARGARALHWFNPLAWLALHRLRVERERACDDVVIGEGSQPGDYASCLLGIVKESRAPAPRLAVTMAGRRLLEGRLRAILDTGRSRGAPRRSTRAVALFLSLTVVAVLAGAHLSPRVAEAGPSDTMSITVSADGSGDYESLQAAIDAAPDGALIFIGPGTFQGPFRIDRPLHLQGAGWNRTTLTSTLAATKAGSAGGEEEALTEKLRAATSEAERRRIIARSRRIPGAGPSPTLLVESARGVTLRGLRVTLTGRHHPDAVMAGAALGFRGSVGRISECAVVGSPNSGIGIDAGSDLTVERSLVAAVWSTGILVGAEGNTPSKVRILSSEVRNCHHRGIQIRPGNDAVLVKDCRISGSAWHGIRYDDTSPTVEGNLIWRNARSGIYASGLTAATVRGNLFFENGIDDISCWEANHDTISGNTFVRSGRASVEVVKGSRPVIRENVFFEHPIAVALQEEVPETGLEGNWFWQCEKAVVQWKSGGQQPIDAGATNHTSNPGFADPARNLFSLPEAAPARLAGAGVTDAPLVAWLWPLQPGEEAVAEERDNRSGGHTWTAKGDTTATAWELARPWIADIRQIENEAKRDAAVETIRRALLSEEPVQNHAALIAFGAAHDVSFDKASFRGAILPLTKILAGPAQVTAFYALYNSERREEDLALVLQALEKPSRKLWESGSHLIYMYTTGDFTGATASKALLALLAHEDARVLKEVMRGIWGANVSGEVEKRLLEIAKRTDCRSDAVYYALSTLNNKSKAVVEFLAEEAVNGNSRALWGLSYGVVEDARSAAGDTFLRLLAARDSDQVRRECIRGLGTYGNASHVGALEALAKNKMLSAETRQQLLELINQLKSRKEK